MKILNLNTSHTNLFVFRRLSVPRHISARTRLGATKRLSPKASGYLASLMAFTVAGSLVSLPAAADIDHSPALSGTVLQMGYDGTESALWLAKVTLLSSTGMSWETYTDDLGYWAFDAALLEDDSCEPEVEPTPSVEPVAVASLPVPSLPSEESASGLSTPAASGTETPTPSAKLSETPSPSPSPAVEPTTPAVEPVETPDAEPTETPDAEPTAEPTHPAVEPVETPDAEPTETPDADPDDQANATTNNSDNTDLPVTGGEDNEELLGDTGQVEDPAVDEGAVVSTGSTNEDDQTPDVQPTVEPTTEPAVEPVETPTPDIEPSETPEPSGTPDTNVSGGFDTLNHQDDETPDAEPSETPTPAVEPVETPDTEPTIEPTVEPSAEPTPSETPEPTEPACTYRVEIDTTGLDTFDFYADFNNIFTANLDNPGIIESADLDPADFPFHFTTIFNSAPTGNVSRAFGLRAFAALASAAVTSPYAPLPPGQVWQETFSSGSPVPGTNTAPVAVTSYVGAGMSAPYTASSFWTPAANLCNGWVLNATSSVPVTDTGCGGNNGGKDLNGSSQSSWYYLRYMAYVLGIANGQSAADAIYNDAVAAQTNVGAGLSNTATPGTLEFEMSGAPAVAGHYYTVSVDFAAMHCLTDPSGTTAGRTDASQSLVLTSGDFSYTVASNVDPCTLSSSAPLAIPGYDPLGPNQSVIKTGNTQLNVKVGYVFLARIAGTQAIQMTTASPNGLGLEVINNTTGTSGNDVAFDNPTILDVTPSVYKAFSPGLIAPGGVSTLTITVVNTTDLLGKKAWNFSDVLPAEVQFASDPNINIVCDGSPVANGDTTQGITATADSGTETFNVSGDLLDGQTYCSISVDVTVPYSNLSADQVEILEGNPAATPPVPADRVTIPNSFNVPSGNVTSDANGFNIYGDCSTSAFAYLYSSVPTFTTGTASGLIGCPGDVLKIEIPDIQVDVGPPLIGKDTSGATTLTWTITVYNSGYSVSGDDNVTADDLVVSSLLGNNLTNFTWGTCTMVSDPTGNSDCGAPSLYPSDDWDITALGAGGTAQITVTATVADDSGNPISAANLTNDFLNSTQFTNSVTVTSPMYSENCTLDPSLVNPVTGIPLCRAIDVTDSNGVIDPLLSVAQDSDRWDQEVTTLPNPALSLSKTANVSEVHFPGDVIEYTFTATNTGNVDLTGVNLSDYLLAGTELAISALQCSVADPYGSVIAASANPASMDIPISDIATCVGDYTVTATDIANHNNPITGDSYATVFAGGVADNSPNADGTAPQPLGNGCQTEFNNLTYLSGGLFYPDGVGLPTTSSAGSTGSIFNNALAVGSPTYLSSLDGSYGQIALGTSTAGDGTVSVGTPITAPAGYQYPNDVNCPAATSVQIVTPSDVDKVQGLPFTGRTGGPLGLGALVGAPMRWIGLAMLAAAVVAFVSPDSPRRRLCPSKPRTDG